MKTETAATGNYRRRDGQSLQRTIALGFLLIAMLSCVVVGTLGTWLRARYMRDKLFRQLETMRDHKIQLLNSWFSERLGDAQALSTEPDVITTCQKYDQGEIFDVETTRADIARFKAAYGYQAAFIADPVSGQAFVTTDPDDATRHRLLDQHRKQVLAEQRILISDVFLDPVHQRPEMIVASLVRSEHDGKVVGILVFQIDVADQLNPLLTDVQRLGESDEIVLVNRDRIVQTPLRLQPEAALNLTIEAEPATRGAAGKTGRIQVGDYREVPVMAAYGHIPHMRWGLVVKQDLAEINAPVVAMALTMSLVSVGALIAAISIGLLIARRIARPAADIAAVAERIGGGDMASRAEETGPSELRLIAGNLNLMVERLGARVRTGSALGDVYAAAGAHNRMANLLKETLPRIMEATHSQVAVVYLANEQDALLELVFTLGIAQDRVDQKLGMTPPDHLLSRVAAAGKVDVAASLPDDYKLAIPTQVGDIRAHALLGIPLMQMGRAAGVVGLASVYEYGEEELGIAETLSLNLAAPILACLASEKSEMMSEELREANEDLTEANERLEALSKERQKQTEELEAQRRALAEADRLKSEFLSNMSHELRTPLNSVLALSQLMISHSAGRIPDEDIEHIRVIERNGRQLLNLINDILDLSKIESGRLETICGVFDARSTIRQALETTRPLSEEKGLELSAHVPDLPTMYSDEDKVRQIVLNLLSNAVKFTDQGEVEVTAMALDDKLSVAVRDTGTGVSAADLPYIFDEFRQADGSTTRRHEGTGLGLAICQRLAGLLGGEITVDSEPNQGSTFTLSLPLRCPSTYEAAGGTATVVELIEGSNSAEPSASQPRAPTEPSPARPRPTSKKILVAEDNPDNMRTITAMLREIDAEYVTAEDGGQAVEAARESRPGLILMDVQLPGVSGLDATRQIRANPDLANTPIVAVTASAMKGDREAILAAGCDDYLSKPIDQTELTSVLRKWMGYTDPG